MELFNKDDIFIIGKQCGFSKVLNWTYEEFQDGFGYLSDHLYLILEVESNEMRSEISIFVKCMPRFNSFKAEYIKEQLFFKKEYIMLSTLFKEFDIPEGKQKWRPKLLFIKEDIFVFENVTRLGYKIVHNQETMIFEELKAAVDTLARFHAQSYIFEERKSKVLGRPYRIWEHYSDYLQEPPKNQTWRDTGRNAAIDFLKVFSMYKSKPGFKGYLESSISNLFKNALELMKPSSKYRNVVIHRDLWNNNIFLKKNTGMPNLVYHAIFVDFQTVLYCSPMLDLSSLIYFNTSRIDRQNWTQELINIYCIALTENLQTGGVNVEDVFDKNTVIEHYEKSLPFAITQSALITPIIAMSKDKREQIFCNPDKAKVADLVSRSEEFIAIAREDDKYRVRITELLDEMVEKFVLPKETTVN